VRHHQRAWVVQVTAHRAVQCIRGQAAAPVTRRVTRPGRIVGGTGINAGGRTTMPMVTVKVIEGVFTQQQKREMI
jgi:hypothetical protein